MDLKGIPDRLYFVRDILNRKYGHTRLLYTLYTENRYSRQKNVFLKTEIKEIQSILVHQERYTPALKTIS